MKPKSSARVSRVRQAGKGRRPPPASRRTTGPRTPVPAVPVAHEGSCHCGAIEYTWTTALPARRWPLQLCQCAFCRGHGARMAADLAGELQFRFERPEFLRRYRFGLRTADFLVCKECGTFVAAVLLSGRGAQGAVNINTLKAMPAGVQPGKPVSWDGESAEQRRARRVQSWTPVVGPV